jgi:PAS domain S-box-containing protein
VVVFARLMTNKPRSEPVSRAPPWLGIVGFALAYFGCALISYDLKATPSNPLTFWLPSGLFLGVLLIVERRHWLLLVLAAGLGDLCYNYYTENSWPFHYWLTAHLGNSLAAVAGAWLVRRWVAERPTLSSFRELVGLVVLGGLVTLPLSATVGALLINYSGSPASYWSNWTSWYCSDLLGVLLLTPALLVWLPAVPRPFLWRFATGELEALTLLIGLLAATSLAYYFSWPQQTEAIYVAFPFVIWAALRFGLQGATGVILITTLLAAWFTAHGFGLIGSSHMTHGQEIVEILFSRGAFVFVGLFPAIALAAQRRAEAALHEKDRVYRDLIENINQSYYVADRRSRFTYCNPALYAMGEYSRDDLDGISCFRLVAEEDRARVMQAYRQWARDPALTEVRCEFRAATKSGRRFWVEQATHFLRDHDGQVIEGRNVLRDITERRQAESRNRELVDYLNKAHDGIFVTDLHNRIIYCNRSIEQLTGWSAAELIGHSPEELTGPSLVGQIQAVRAAVQATGTWQGEFQLTGKHGRTLTLATSITLICDDDGEPTARLTIMTDITARLQTEHRLQLQGAALQAAANAIVITDRDGIIEWVNPAFTALTGYSVEEAVGRNPQVLVKSGRQDDAYYKNLWDTILAGQVWRGEIINRRKDGSLCTEAQTITPVCNGRGEICHFIAIKEDITERRRAEAILTLAHRRVSVLAQLGRELAEAATPRAAALAVIEAARTLLGWDCCWLHDWNEGEQAFENPVNFDLVGGERCEIASSLVYPLKPSPFMRRVMQEGPQLLLRENEDEKAEGLRPFGTRQRSLSLMFAPIRRAGQLQGIISIQSYTQHAYDQAALDLLQTLADHCAGALARIQTRAALAATEERFRLVWENATDGMRLTEAEGRMVAVNDAFCRLIGKPRNEIEGQFLSVLYAEPDGRRILARHQEWFAQHNVPAHLEQHLTLWDGRTRWLEVSNCFIETDPARPLLLGIFRDITERKLAEEALKATERRMSDLINTTEGIVWEADATTFDFTFVSQKAEQLLGYPLKDWLTPGFWLSHLHPDDQAWASEYCVSCTRRLEAHSFDYRFIARDGRTVWLHDIVTVVPENGAPRWLRGINVDITERKLAEARLREQAEVMDKAPVAIIITDLSHRVTYCNEGARRLYGFTDAQMLGHTADELFTAETMRVLGAGRTATLATGSWRGEVPIETRDGRRVTAEFIMSLIRDSAGRPFARLSLAVDVTEKIQMEEQVKRMQRLESLGMLAAGVAHDMNNILAPILMAVPLLKTRVNDDRSQGMLTTLQKSGERGAALVRQLLSFAHGASGEFTLIQARHVLKDIAEMVTASFPKNVRLAAELPGDLWPVIGNASQLHQVFLNLCINARDAMPDGGTLHLEAANRRLTPEAAQALPNARPGAFLAVTVADTGTGIPPEILERIWEPFFTTKTPDKGTGLGLSTVRGIVAQHQGFLVLQTHAGRGTTFTVYLPADEASVRGESRPVSATPLPHGAGELVLVVDDEVPVREMVAGTLEHFGYRVLSAGDGAEAIASFATHAEEVRLVVTDLQMPLLDGKNLITALLRIRPGLPVICMSGADTVSKSLTPFISAFLTKPFTVEALLETTHAALHRSSGGAG